MSSASAPKEPLSLVLLNWSRLLNLSLPNDIINIIFSFSKDLVPQVNLNKFISLNLQIKGKLRTKRIEKEINRIKKYYLNNDSNLINTKLLIDSTNFYHFLLFIFVDKGIYQNGLFVFEIFLNNKYPMVSPKILSLTKLYHPRTSISPHRLWYYRCWEVKKWLPKYTLKNVIMDLKSVVYVTDNFKNYGQCNDRNCCPIKALHTKWWKEYNLTARFVKCIETAKIWTKLYANDPMYIKKYHTTNLTSQKV